MDKSQHQIDACGIFNPRQQIPGWLEAVNAEVESRNDAMLGFGEKICGLSVRPLTARHLLWLDIYQSPFLAAAPASALMQLHDIHLHIARFMWVLSPDWRPYSKIKRRLFFWRYRKVLYGSNKKTDELIKKITNFVSDSLFDLKTDSALRGKNYFSMAAGIVHLLCQSYGSLSPSPDSPNAAIDVPLKVVGQLIRARIYAEDHKRARRILSNRSDELEQNWLVELNQRLKKN